MNLVSNVNETILDREKFEFKQDLKKDCVIINNLCKGNLDILENLHPGEVFALHTKRQMGSQIDK